MLGLAIAYKSLLLAYSGSTGCLLRGVHKLNLEAAFPLTCGYLTVELSGG